MTEQVSIEKALNDATTQLRAVSESARLDAELLLARSIDVPRSYLFAHPGDTLDAAALDRLGQTLGRRLAGEPMAYITGIKEFWSMELIVSPATLVPRPETELLVEIALRDIPRKADWPLLDLGTGSGAIALALARERQLCSVTAVDVSQDALAVARENANRLMISNVEFLAGDWTSPVAGRTFKVIVSNPPYVASGDKALERLRAEPLAALAAGTDGLDSIRILARDCTAIIDDGGMLLLEHGAEQQDQVARILLSYGWQHIQCYDDYSGHPRVSSAIFRSSETT
ncbi:MAG: peptide chain release factor N(5)-glutamine methyltransferase [Gammaproteobacteria bacterium]|nr:peptide chain release factor N(5)-glutamine methyltransferase [Gammaproteobacteria bacterium]MDH3429562.1 peptide chain release factor N(5)-glutamine methyltransferase [Gammaproteobacteria bacterium]MDH3434141.1 peptide chain release factor N(5)-glutamine methyltransferase [Gammaproteobacteria bacterium]